MIVITGDTHGDFRRFNTEIFPEQKQMTKEDYVIICGDFGGIWSQDADERSERYWLNWLSSKNFTTLFVDGNHENFERLMGYPVEEWHGGKVHKISESVIHLMRGQVYDIHGLKIFTFGGASSHDIADGILEPDDPQFKDKKKRLDKIGGWYRVNRVSWWKEELPSEEEMHEGIQNLEKNDWKVDYIITHCGSSNLQKIIGKSSYQPDCLTEYFNKIQEKCEYRYWFCGHYHENLNVSKRDKVLYEQLIPIG